MLTEEWKSIKDYEGLYEISNMGKVKSLERKVKSNFNRIVTRKERQLKWYIDSCGYIQIKLCKEGMMKNFLVHHLVWDAFGNKERNGRKLQVDHIDENKKNPIITNLRLATNRQNVSSFILNKKKSGLPTGVVYNPTRIRQVNKYSAQININGEHKYLGRFPTPELASMAYQQALNTLVTV